LLLRGKGLVDGETSFVGGSLAFKWHQIAVGKGLVALVNLLDGRGRGGVHQGRRDQPGPACRGSRPTASGGPQCTGY